MPFIGDLVGVLLSSYIVGEAARLGVSRSILARMAFNVAVEGLVGLIPFAGDVFDAAWKANQWLDRPGRAARSSRLLVLMTIAALVAFALLTVFLTYLLLRWLVA